VLIGKVAKEDHCEKKKKKGSRERKKKRPRERKKFRLLDYNLYEGGGSDG